MTKSAKLFSKGSFFASPIAIENGFFNFLALF